MPFDLYKLCNNELNVGSIRVVLDDSLKEQILLTIAKLKKKRTLKEISSLLNIDYTTLWDYCNRKSSIPLVILSRLEKISYRLFLNKNCFFVCGQAKTKTKLPKNISPELAKIVGAIIADGHLRIRPSERGYHYELILRDEYQSNLLAFVSWFEKVFSLKLDIKKQDNYYFVYCSNKLVVLFLIKIIGLPSGRKVEFISVPKAFKNINYQVKLSLLQGIFMFDGGVDYSTGYISLVSRSDNLISDVNQLLGTVYLIPDYVSTKADKYNRKRIIFRKKAKLQKGLALFEKGSEKWFRLSEHLYGLKAKTTNFNQLCFILDRYYPKKRKKVITFSDVLLAVKELGPNADLLNIGKKLKKRRTTVYSNLNKLTKWKILSARQFGFKKYWRLNKKYYIPRR